MAADVAADAAAAVCSTADLAAPAHSAAADDAAAAAPATHLPAAAPPAVRYTAASGVGSGCSRWGGAAQRNCCASCHGWRVGSTAGCSGRFRSRHRSRPELLGWARPLVRCKKALAEPLFAQWHGTNMMHGAEILRASCAHVTDEAQP